MDRSLLISFGIVVAGLIPNPGGSPAANAGEAEQKFPTRWHGEELPAGRESPFATDVGLSRDGRRLLVGWSTGLRVWDLSTGQAVTLYHDADIYKGVNSPRLSPDGRWVVGIRGSEPVWELVIWDATTGKDVRVEPKTTRDP